MLGEFCQWNSYHLGLSIMSLSILIGQRQRGLLKKFEETTTTVPWEPYYIQNTFWVFLIADDPPPKWPNSQVSPQKTVWMYWMLANFQIINFSENNWRSLTHDSLLEREKKALYFILYMGFNGSRSMTRGPVNRVNRVKIKKNS